MADGVQLQARTVPHPASVSQRARDALAFMAANPRPVRPNNTDPVAWKADGIVDSAAGLDAWIFGDATRARRSAR